MHIWRGSGNSLLKILLPAWIFCIQNVSCSKDDIQSNHSNGTETATIKKLIAIKTTDWKNYPYIGGYGEDSVYFSWSTDLGAYVSIDSVIIFSSIRKKYYAQQSGNYQATSDYDVYSYQPGASLNAPTKILLWWVQKVPGTQPDADSAFFYLRY